MAAKPVLLGTDIPGVYLNKHGIQCDDRGIALTFLQIKRADEARFVEAVGAIPNTPAELMRAVAMDPRNSLGVRFKAAKEAAPYFDRKMPLAVESTVSAGALDLAKLALMPKAKRQALLDLLKEAGVQI